MKKLIEWHQNMVFKFMVKLNLGVYEIAWISWIKGLLMGAILTLLCSCGVQFQYGVLNSAGQIDGIYQSPDTKVDTISSVFDLKRKLRNDFNFRWDFAQYAMQQPYSFYWNNPRLDGIWRPYNRFDVYFHSNWFWTDWAYNYPFHHTWGWNNWYHWNRPYYYYGWYRPYRPWNNWYQGPFNNSSYNVVYNASRRGSLTSNLNRSISNRINTNRITNINNRPVNNNAINTLINNYKPNNNNNYKPSNSNNNIIVKPNNNWKPSNNNYKPNNNYSRPSNNFSRPSSNYSRPSSNVISRPSSSSRGGKINRE